MADRKPIITSTPRQAEKIEESDEEYEDFIGFDQRTETYREMEEDISSIDNKLAIYKTNRKATYY